MFGHEVDGLRPELLAMADAHVRIPMLGKKKSLNVATAGEWCCMSCCGSGAAWSASELNHRPSAHCVPARSDIVSAGKTSV